MNLDELDVLVAEVRRRNPTVDIVKHGTSQYSVAGRFVHLEVAVGMVGRPTVMVFDGPLHQPLQDYINGSSKNEAWPQVPVVQSALHAVPEAGRVSFEELFPTTRAEAMQLAMMEATSREEHARDHLRKVRTGCSTPNASFSPGRRESPVTVPTPQVSNRPLARIGLAPPAILEPGLLNVVTPVSVATEKVVARICSPFPRPMVLPSASAFPSAAPATRCRSMSPMIGSRQALVNHPPARRAVGVKSTRCLHLPTPCVPMPRSLSPSSWGRNPVSRSPLPDARLDPRGRRAAQTYRPHQGRISGAQFSPAAAIVSAASVREVSPSALKSSSPSLVAALHSGVVEGIRSVEYPTKAWRSSRCASRPDVHLTVDRSAHEPEQQGSRLDKCLSSAWPSSKFTSRRNLHQAADSSSQEPEQELRRSISFGAEVALPAAVSVSASASSFHDAAQAKSGLSDPPTSKMRQDLYRLLNDFVPSSRVPSSPSRSPIARSTPLNSRLGLRDGGLSPRTVASVRSLAEQISTVTTYDTKCDFARRLKCLDTPLLGSKSGGSALVSSLSEWARRCDPVQKNSEATPAVVAPSSTYTGQEVASVPILSEGGTSAWTELQAAFSSLRAEVQGYHSELTSAVGTRRKCTVTG